MRKKLRINHFSSVTQLTARDPEFHQKNPRSSFQGALSRFSEISPLLPSDFEINRHIELPADEKTEAPLPFSEKRATDVSDPSIRKQTKKEAGPEPAEKAIPSLLSLSEISDSLLEYADLISIDRQLFRFDGEIYKRISKKNFLSLLQEVLPETLQKRIGNLRKVEDTYEWLVSSQKIPRYTAEELYAQNRYLIPFKNGVFDAEKGRLLPYSQSAPVLFKLDAVFTERILPAPTWDSFTDTVFKGNADDRQRLLEMIGYVLMPANDGKVFFVLGIAPNSGKSQFANFLVMTLGQDLVSHVNLHDLKNRFYLEQTVGKQVNICMDLQSGPLKEEAVSNIKQLTGEQWIEVEAKYEAPHSAFTTCKLICGTNHPLEITGSDPAFWNRLIFIPFLYSCPESDRNTNLAADLYKERDSILSEAAWAAHQLIQREFIFTPSETADSIVAQWVASQDPISHFIEAFCEVTGSKDDFIEINELFQVFQQNTGAASLSLQYFSKEVRARYSAAFAGNNNKKRVGNRTVNVIFGLRWKISPTLQQFL